jgi:hypothetical protein
VLIAGYGIFECSRLVQAEPLARRDTVSALESALRIEPGNAEYHARIAVLDATRNDELETALRLNPRAQSLWIMRSVHQEEEDDVAGAEKSLQRANLVSQYYMPRWSLAAFYYRQGRREEFLEWGRKALSVGYGAPDSIFRMAQRLQFTPAEILNRLIPKSPERVSAYLELVLRDGDLDAAFEAGGKLLEIGTKSDRDRVGEACDGLFAAGRIGDAVGLWNRTIQAGWIDLKPLDVARGASLSDGTFAKTSLQMGFDWRYAAISGVWSSTSHADSSLRLEFSGNQPESCELLSQPVPLLPDRRYKLVARYRTDGIVAAGGLRWRVQSLDRKLSLLDGVMSKATEDYADETFEFRTPAQKTPATIVLAYTRSPGTTRIEGRLWLQSVKLELVP